MYNLLAKRGQLLAFGLGILICVIFLASAIGGGAGEIEMLPDEEKYASTIFNFGLSAAIALTVIAALGMLTFGVYQVATRLKASMQGLIGLGVIVAIFFIAFSSTPGACASGDLSEGVCKFIGGGITTALVMISLAAIGFIVGEVLSLLK